MSFLGEGKIEPKPITRQKLYCVSVETEIYVVAMDEDEAEEIAERALDEDRIEPDFVSAREVVTPLHIDHDWLHGIPFGIETDETCEQILERFKAENPEAYNHPAQRRLPFMEEVEWPHSAT